jgi:hypothetical protein
MEKGANASSQPLVLLHTVTVPAALRLFLPHLPAGLHKTALAYVWQNVAAVAGVYTDEKPSESEDWHTHEESVIIVQLRRMILTRSSSPRHASGSIA